MTKADMVHSTSSCDIHELDHDPADTSITATALDQAYEAAARLLPAYWFNSQIRADVIHGQHYDSLAFIQTAGVPVGDYSIHREPSRQFSLFCVAPEPDHTGNTTERDLGRFETMEEIVRAIREDLQRGTAKVQERANRWAAALAA